MTHDNEFNSAPDALPKRLRAGLAVALARQGTIGIWYASHDGV